MTEAEWLTVKLPTYMLRDYPGHWNERKGGLAKCACLRRAPQLLSHELLRDYLGVVERRIEGEACTEEGEHLWKAITRAMVVSGSATDPNYMRCSLARELALNSTRNSVIYVLQAITHMVSLLHHHSYTSREYRSAESLEESAQCTILREIFGNPFRPVVLNSTWCTTTAVSLAQHIYASRDFSAMPILADALQDAGCDSEEMLSHCRGEGPHVRGCWVVDLVLGKPSDAVKVHSRTEDTLKGPH
jgi:hypothetical protein